MAEKFSLTQRTEKMLQKDIVNTNRTYDFQTSSSLWRVSKEVQRHKNFDKSELSQNFFLPFRSMTWNTLGRRSKFTNCEGTPRRNPICTKMSSIWAEGLKMGMKTLSLSRMCLLGKTSLPLLYIEIIFSQFLTSWASNQSMGIELHW